MRARLTGVDGDTPEDAAPREPEQSARTHHLVDTVAAESRTLEAKPFLDSAPEPAPAPSVLRRHVEENAESLWAIFAEALTATTDAGKPDHRVRLLAARSLLTEVYGQTASPVIRQDAADELAALRTRRLTQRP